MFGGGVVAGGWHATVSFPGPRLAALAVSVRVALRAWFQSAPPSFQTPAISTCFGGGLWQGGATPPSVYPLGPRLAELAVSLPRAAPRCSSQSAPPSFQAPRHFNMFGEGVWQGGGTPPSVSPLGPRLAALAVSLCRQPQCVHLSPPRRHCGPPPFQHVLGGGCGRWVARHHLPPCLGRGSLRSRYRCAGSLENVVSLPLIVIPDPRHFNMFRGGLWQGGGMPLSVSLLGPRLAALAVLLCGQPRRLGFSPPRRHSRPPPFQHVWGCSRGVARHRLPGPPLVRLAPSGGGAPPERFQPLSRCALKLQPPTRGPDVARRVRSTDPKPPTAARSARAVRGGARPLSVSSP